MKISVADATNAQLDWLVAECNGEAGSKFCTRHGVVENVKQYHPSTNCMYGHPLIEQMGDEGLILMRDTLRPNHQWRASLNRPHGFYYGPTALVAAMRCFVASRMGAEVEVPDELRGEA